jgi:hypothetical protein
LKSRLALAQPLFRALRIIDILQDRDRARDLAGPIAEGSRDDANPGFASVAHRVEKIENRVTVSPRSALAPGY